MHVIIYYCQVFYNAISTLGNYPNRFKLITFIQISEYQQFMILYFATNNNFVHVRVLVMLRNHQPVMRCTPCVHRVTQGEEMDAM